MRTRRRRGLARDALRASIYVQGPDVEALRRAVRASGMATSTWIREVVVAAAQAGLRPSRDGDRVTLI